jgi:Primase C terminal 1 (PriCT-1)
MAPRATIGRRRPLLNRARFLEALFGGADTDSGQVVLWRRANRRALWLPLDRLEEANRIIPRDSEDVFVAVALHDQRAALAARRRANPAYVRGCVASAVALAGLQADVDVQGPAHRREDLPRTFAAARELISRFPLKFTILMNSGHGLVPLWLFRELWVFDGTSDREEATNLCRRFHATLQSYARQQGWSLDTVSDLARLARLPETINAKLPDRVAVEVVEWYPENRYNPSEFEPYLEKGTPLRREVRKRVDTARVLAGVTEGRRDVELFRLASKLRQTDVPRDEAEQLVLRAASNCDPPFPEKEALTKVASAYGRYRPGRRPRREGAARERRGAKGGLADGGSAVALPPEAPAEHPTSPPIEDSTQRRRNAEDPHGTLRHPSDPHWMRKSQCGSEEGGGEEPERASPAALRAERSVRSPVVSTDGEEFPVAESLADHVRFAAKVNREALRKADGWMGAAFTFARYLKGHPRLRDLTPQEAADRVDEMLDELLPGSANPWVDLLGDADSAGNPCDPFEDFVHAWDHVKYPAGATALEMATRLAESHPLPMSEYARPRWERYRRFVCICHWLQALQREGNIFLSVRKFGEILGTDKTTISHYRQRAEEDGYLIKVREHAGRMATEYQFNPEKLTAPTALSGGPERSAHSAVPEWGETEPPASPVPHDGREERWRF